jgi:dTDP-L-rhamnose 4-epimerase
VTGGAGFIGSHTVDLLVEQGHQVTVLDNLDPQVHGREAVAPRHLAGQLAAGKVRFLRGDVTVREDLARALEGIDTVVHLAATVGVGQSMYLPSYYTNTNCQGTGLLLELVVERRERVKKLVVASSMSLYGEGAYHCPECGGAWPGERTAARLSTGAWEVPCARCDTNLTPQPTPESKPAEIASIYAATKKHQEDLFISFGRAYGIPTFALRFFNVFGPRQSLSNPYTGVAAIFLSRLLAGQPPLVFEDGLQSRDFVEVRDVARAVVAAAMYRGAGAHVLNIGTGRALSVVGVAEALSRALGVTIPAELLGRYRAGDVRHCVADAARAQEVLDWTAERTFEGSLGELITWCRSETPTDSVKASLTELEQRGLVR